MKNVLRLLSRFVLVALALVVFFAAGRWLFISPSLDRDWKVEHSVLPEVEMDDQTVEVRNIRNFRYHDSGEFDANYYDRTFRIEDVDSVWFVLSPFRDNWRGPAHSFLSFGFSDSTFVAVSVEARKEVGEDYSIWKGLVHNYELLYVIGDERDLIGLRAAQWNDDVFVYPIRARKEQIQELFVAMMERAQKLSESPEFYNTASNNCTTNIYDHVRELAPDAWGRFDWRLLLPGYADELAFENGIIDTDLDLEEARRVFRVNDRVAVALEQPHFGMRIRGAGPGVP